MRAIEFDKCNVVIGKDQPEYLPLPAFAARDGMVVTCWELNKEEMDMVKETGKFFLTVWTGNRPFQPILAEAENPLNKKEDGK